MYTYACVYMIGDIYVSDAISLSEALSNSLEGRSGHFGRHRIRHVGTLQADSFLQNAKKQYEIPHKYTQAGDISTHRTVASESGVASRLHHLINNQQQSTKLIQSRVDHGK